MFAESDDNEFKQSGVMTTMKKVDQHIDAVCWWAKLLRRAVVGALGFVALLGSAYAAIKVLI